MVCSSVLLPFFLYFLACALFYFLTCFFPFFVPCVLSSFSSWSSILTFISPMSFVLLFPSFFSFSFYSSFLSPLSLSCHPLFDPHFKPCKPPYLLPSVVSFFPIPSSFIHPSILPYDILSLQSVFSRQGCVKIMTFFSFHCGEPCLKSKREKIDFKRK